MIKWDFVRYIRLKFFMCLKFRLIGIIDGLIMRWNSIDSGEIFKVGSQKGAKPSRTTARCSPPLWN